MTQHDSADPVERLIKLAGEPDQPSPAGTQRARAASERAWRQMLATPAGRTEHRGRWLQWGIPLAASLVAAWWFIRPVPEAGAPIVLGEVVALEGGATGRNDAGEWSLATHQPLHAGTILQTAQGRLAVSLGSALSLRMDRDTRLRVEQRDRVTLLAGSLYVDSGGLNVNSPLRITTPAGEVSHIGTQFQVYVADELTRVRVREGRVLLTARDGGAPQNLATGDVLEVHGEQQVITRGMPTFGGEWAWAANVAPVLEIENRPLTEFLAWLVREQGWQLRYASDALQEQAGSIRLHGKLEGLDAAAMLERVALITGVPLQTRDGVLWVGVPR